MRDFLVFYAPTIVLFLSILLAFFWSAKADFLKEDDSK